jgi:quercetin dioxygenase-like cupin family protein
LLALIPAALTITALADLALVSALCSLVVTYEAIRYRTARVQVRHLSSRPERRLIMEITRNSTETTPGPSEWFTGAVYLDAVARPSGASRLSASSVHFTPGARTAWHTHPNGQTIYVLEGVGLAQRRGGPVEVIRPGDSVFFVPGEDHWHGAAPTRFMTHLAMLEVDDEGVPATWGDHVTDEEYAQAPPIDG